ncbi:unnamed protein product [Lymnaea stagnalis]|uniref:Uncharacterized protein n=1 Tax=Lymnaea stagnalis TaxID=6523 RepID=A0AAV2IDG0_LYMST
MTLIGSWYFFIALPSVLYMSAQSCTTSGVFKNWFGANCQYKCHCKNDVACNVTNGDCPNGCDIGWFGPACQYADLAKTSQLTLIGGTSQDNTKITDGDDTTCTSLTGSSFYLYVTWASKIYFTWLRIIISNGELQKEIISIKFPDDATTQNVECQNVFVDKITMDIYCTISKPIQGIVLNGSSVNTLCSLYISKDCGEVLASGIGIGIGVMIAADIIIGIVICIWFKRRQKPPLIQRDTTVRRYDHVNPIQQNEHPYDTVDKSGDAYDLIEDVVSFNKYNNSVVTDTSKTSHTNTGGSSVSS